MNPGCADKSQGEGLFVRLECLFPIGLAHHHSISGFTHIGEKPGELQLLTAVESRLMEEIDEVAGLLKLYREKEGGGDIDSPDLPASLSLGCRPRLTLINLALPKSHSRCVSFATEKIGIVLPHEKV